jgi:hypothetical protein
MHLDRDGLLALAESRTSADDPHLAACSRCRAEVDALRDVMGRLVDEVPEPSPLFWEHFSARVRAAVADQQLAPAPAWWAGWRPWTYALGTCAAMVLVVGIAWPHRPAPAVTVATGASAVAETDAPSLALVSDEEWELVVDVAVAESPEGIDTVLAPSAAELGVQDLSGDEQSALASLLRAELDGHTADPGV